MEVGMPETASSLPRRVNMKEMAAALGYSVIHTRRLIKLGKIPAPDSIGGRKYGWPMEVLVALTSPKKEAA